MGQSLEHRRTMKKYDKYKRLEKEHSDTKIREKLKAPTEYEKYRQMMERRKHENCD